MTTKSFTDLVNDSHYGRSVPRHESQTGLLLNDGTPTESAATQIVSLGGGAASMVHQTTVTLTDAQIKALPSTEAIIFSPTEVLDFSGVPTQMIVPLQAVLILDSRGGAYTNIGNAIIEFNFGAADRLNAPASLAEPLAEASITYMVVPFPAFSVQAGVLDVPWFFLLDNYEDNGLRLKVANAGAFTGGGVANTLRVSLAYMLFNTSTGEFDAA